VPFIWEINDENKADDADQKSDLYIYYQRQAYRSVQAEVWTYDTLHNKDPHPPGVPLETVHLTEAKTQDPRQGRCNAADNVKRGVSLLYIVWRTQERC
jgi:hypothetical protein